MTDYLSQEQKGNKKGKNITCFLIILLLLLFSNYGIIKYELTGTVDKSNDTNHKIGELSPNKKSRYCLATVNGDKSMQIKSSELLE